MATTQIPAPLGQAKPTRAPHVPAGANSLAATATRRSLLGAIAAVPMLAAPAVAIAAPRSEWHAAISDWEQTRATWNPILDALDKADSYAGEETPATKAEHERIAALSYEWMEKDDAALRQIIATPAPDIEAVIYKIRLGSEHELRTEEAVISDLRRLTREG
jgi:hypothetical protein